jgi:hypothetical protein
MYMDRRLATLKAVSFYLLHNVSTLNQCRKLSFGTFWCKHFASYQGYPYERCWKSTEKPILSKNLIKQLHNLQILHLNRCLATEYSETAAHCNGNFDTDNQIYVP